MRAAPLSSTAPYRVLDLFAGIGGFSLGLDRSGGFKTVAFCEIENFPQKILKKCWPGVPIYEDVRKLTAERLKAKGIIPNVITAGFPCQDVSAAGLQEGIVEGTRSGLWSECSRLLGEIQPDFAVFENVTALISGKQELGSANVAGSEPRGESLMEANYQAFMDAKLAAGILMTKQQDLMTNSGFHEFSETFPRSGIMRNGTVYQLQQDPWALPIKEIESGSYAIPNTPKMWPTPTKRDYKGCSPGGRYRDGVKQLDTVDRVVNHLDGPGPLNPQFVEWLMGFPIDHTESRP